MLADNIVWLKENKPEIYYQVKGWEEQGKRPNFILEKAKDGNDTLKYQNDGKTIYIHSKYSPVREADAIIDQLAEQKAISKETQVLFYGIGLGYHIQAFIRHFPDTDFLIVEPSVEIMSAFLEQKLLKNILSKNLKLLQCGSNPENLYNRIIQLKEKKLVIYEHPVYPKIFEQDHAAFLEKLKNIVKEQRSSLHTNYAFKQRWVINSVNNFKEVIKTPNILMENNGVFEGKTAIMVAAGPSLDFEIENLKKIKELGTAYIFSVGSAINSLIHHDIEPDAMCTYDPTEKNQITFNKINEMNIDFIPMIFGSSVSYEVLAQYSGPKYHMITSQDTVARYFLKTVNHKPIEVINDAPSIAVVTLELLIKLGFSKIILVGQNLAYFEDQIYSSDIDYITDEIKENMLNSNELVIESVDGNKVKTSESYLIMKKQMEAQIARHQVNVINTTVGGAKIEGTTFCKLQKLLEVELNERIISGKEFDQIEFNEAYDKTYILKQFVVFKDLFQKYEDLITKIRIDLEKMRKLVDHQSKNQIRKVHQHMENLIQIMEANDFFKTIAMPLNRVEYGILVNQAQCLKLEKNDIIKIKNILKPTESFINLLWLDLQLNRDIVTVLENVINDYTEGIV